MKMIMFLIVSCVGSDIPFILYNVHVALVLPLYQVYG